MPRLTSEQRERAILMLSVVTAQPRVAELMNCHVSSIERLVRRVRDTGTTSDRPRSGRPSVTSASVVRYLRTLHPHNWFLTVTSSARNALPHPVSRRTIARRLRLFGLGAYRPLKGMTLTRQHRQARLRWARTVQQWQRRNWDGVLFTDECRFQVFTVDGWVRVYRRRGERTARCCVQEASWRWQRHDLGRHLWRYQKPIWWSSTITWNPTVTSTKSWSKQCYLSCRTTLECCLCRTTQLPIQPVWREHSWMPTTLTLFHGLPVHRIWSLCAPLVPAWAANSQSSAWPQR